MYNASEQFVETLSRHLGSVPSHQSTYNGICGYLNTLVTSKLPT